MWGDLGKIIVATSFEWLPKAQKITKFGHTSCGLSVQVVRGCVFDKPKTLYKTLFHTTGLTVANQDVNLIFSRTSKAEKALQLTKTSHVIDKIQS